MHSTRLDRASMSTATMPAASWIASPRSMLNGLAVGGDEAASCRTDPPGDAVGKARCERCAEGGEVDVVRAEAGFDIGPSGSCRARSRTVRNARPSAARGGRPDRSRGAPVRRVRREDRRDGLAAHRVRRGRRRSRTRARGGGRRRSSGRDEGAPAASPYDGRDRWQHRCRRAHRGSSGVRPPSPSVRCRVG